LWFDSTRAQAELGWAPKYSNAAMVIDSYEWFTAHRDELEADVAGDQRSHHQSPARMGLLRLAKHIP
jgi:hypothetical protein